MALSNCEKCWETPCVCGHDYKDRDDAWIDSQIAMLVKIKEERAKDKPPVVPKSWPKSEYMNGANIWYHDADKFVAFMKQFPNFWPFRPELKYLNLRIDTRFNSFILQLDDETRVSVDEVLNSLREYVKDRMSRKRR